MNIIRLILILSIILVFSIIGIYILIYKGIPYDINNTIRFEIIKSLLGIISISVIGGVISAILKSYERSREQSNLRVQAKIDFMKKTDELYRTIKSSRRKLIANGIKALNPPLLILIDQKQIQIYLKEMEIVNGIQLEFEGMSVSLKNHKLFNYPKEVLENIEKMEKYLRKLLKESEDKFTMLKEKESIDIDILPILKDFTSEERNSDFQNKFPNSYHKIISHLS